MPLTVPFGLPWRWGRNRAAETEPQAQWLSDREITDRLGIGFCDHSEAQDAALTLFLQGRHAARQSAWQTLCAQLSPQDTPTALTPAGTSRFDLLCAGALSDVSVALGQASRRNKLGPSAPAMAAVETLCEELAAPPLGHSGACLRAHVLMTAAWAYFDQGHHRRAPHRHLTEFKALFDRAAAAIAPWQDHHSSPALAAARCALLAGDPEAESRVLQLYEAQWQLSPRRADPLRAFGLHLQPEWFGAAESQDIQARRAAVATQASWGRGGYTWVWLDALASDPGGFQRLDTDLFLDGLDDILARHNHQHYVNLFAAMLSCYLARGPDRGHRSERSWGQDARLVQSNLSQNKLSLRQGATRAWNNGKTLGAPLGDGTGPDRHQAHALRIKRDALLRGHLTEIHSWIWALAPQTTPARLPDGGRMTAALIEIGRHRAKHALAEPFGPDLCKR